uniref:Uncharacterized protein n=2 Tax=Oryza TaxID=4527 RepID=A0A0E0CGE4_9ORYZ
MATRRTETKTSIQQCASALLSILYKGMKPDQKARVNGVEFGELVLPGRGRIAVSADSVHRVFGLPNGGDPVPYEFDSTADAFIDSPYGLTGKQRKGKERQELQTMVVNQESQEIFMANKLEA